MSGEHGRMLRVASANLQHGGLSVTGDPARLDATIAVLRRADWDPDIVLVQEVTARAEPGLVQSRMDMPRQQRENLNRRMSACAEAAAREHLDGIASRLGMRAVLGPVQPWLFSRSHPAILVRDDPALEIVLTGPPTATSSGADPSWCQAGIMISGLAYPLVCYSVHLPARSAVMQRMQAEWLASVIAQRGELAIVGGDWNCYARAGAPSTRELEAMPPHLRPPRMVCDHGRLRPDHAVHDTLAGTGLADAAAHLAGPDRQELAATTERHGRIDRFYVTPELLPALRQYRHEDIGGSDHHLIGLTLDMDALAQAEPPGPTP